MINVNEFLKCISVLNCVHCHSSISNDGTWISINTTPKRRICGSCFTPQLIEKYKKQYIIKDIIE